MNKEVQSLSDAAWRLTGIEFYGLSGHKMGLFIIQNIVQEDFLFLQSRKSDL